MRGGNWELGRREPGIGETGTGNEAGVQQMLGEGSGSKGGGKRKSGGREAGVKGEGSGNCRPPCPPL